MRRVSREPPSWFYLSVKGDEPERELVELVRADSAAVLRLARRLVGDADDARDVAQEALARAYQGLRGFRGDSSLRTWVHRIVVRESLRLLRRRRLREWALGWLLPRRAETPLSPSPEHAL